MRKTHSIVTAVALMSKKKGCVRPRFRVCASEMVKYRALQRVAIKGSENIQLQEIELVCPA